jgi:hypothetical protein
MLQDLHIITFLLMAASGLQMPRWCGMAINLGSRFSSSATNIAISVAAAVAAGVPAMVVAREKYVEHVAVIGWIGALSSCPSSCQRTVSRIAGKLSVGPFAGSVEAG